MAKLIPNQTTTPTPTNERGIIGGLTEAIAYERGDHSAGRELGADLRDLVATVPAYVTVTGKLRFWVKVGEVLLDVWYLIRRRRRARDRDVVNGWEATLE